MSLGVKRTAAWRLAIPGFLVFALGSGVVMAFLYSLVGSSIRRRGDAWITAEVGGVARLLEDERVQRRGGELETELAELENHEALIPLEPEDRRQSLFFFAIVDPLGHVVDEAVHGDRGAYEYILSALSRSDRGSPRWVRIPGREYPARVAWTQMGSGERLIAAATPFADMELLEDVRDVGLEGWLLVVVTGFAVTWLSVRRVLSRVERLTESVGAITVDDLAQRLPHGGRGDEIDNLATAFNGLLDRIEQGVHQIRAVADAVAHDLKTPLTTISGTLEILQTEEDPAVMRLAAAEAMLHVRRLEELIETTLDVAEAEAGALRLKPERMDLSAVTRELIELYEPAAEAAGIHLSLSAPEPVSVMADSRLVRRVLINLLDNAMAHLPEGTRVQVRVAMGGGGPEVEVVDDGPGFALEIRNRAFERLVRGPGSRGSGLGLALVRAILVAHGGTVSLEHPGGGGSVMRLLFPKQG